MITLTRDGASAGISPRGAAVNSWVVDGVDLVLGHPGDAARAASPWYLGEVVGPFANRIAGAVLPLPDGDHRLAANDRGNSLHGGPAGFSRCVWQVAGQAPDAVALELDWTDPAGGFPGRHRARVEYRLEAEALVHRIAVTVDATTVLSPCSHPYFNLVGAGDVLDHVLSVAADAYLPVDATGIPLPEAPLPVAGTDFDLRAGRRLGDLVASPDPQLVAAGGIDHAFVLTDGRPAAVLTAPGAPWRLELHTDRPSLQVFTSASMADPDHLGAWARAYAGVALEAQGFPDAPRRPDFPSVLVEAGVPWASETAWRLVRTR